MYIFRVEVRSHPRLSLCSCTRPLVPAYTSLPILRVLSRVNLGAYRWGCGARNSLAALEQRSLKLYWRRTAMSRKKYQPNLSLALLCVVGHV